MTDEELVDALRARAADLLARVLPMVDTLASPLLEAATRGVPAHERDSLRLALAQEAAELYLDLVTAEGALRLLRAAVAADSTEPWLATVRAVAVRLLDARRN